MIYHQTIFDNELNILKEAKEIAKNEQYVDNTLLPKYRELLTNYEKLLKTSIKTTKISDIQGTTLKNQENEIKAINESLKKEQQTRRRLFSEISHELGSPMIAIESFVHGMVNESIKPEQRFLVMIHEKVALVNRLIEELFDLAKLEEQGTMFRFEEIPIKELYTFFSKFSIECERNGITLIISPIESQITETLYVSIDSFRFQQVVTNVIENAIKYTPTEGIIEISMLVLSNEDLLLIEVKDTGLGIDAESLPYVFERFYKRENPLYPQTNSTGLGLAIAKEIIKKHGGQIGVKSVEGKGSNFHFSLPLYSNISAIKNN